MKMQNNIIGVKQINRIVRVEKWVPYIVNNIMTVCPHDRYPFMEPCIECSKNKYKLNYN